MLKKAVTVEIIPVTRQCKCGSTVLMNPTENGTRCDKCGELVCYENAKKSSRDSDTESRDSDQYISDGENSAPK